jgi:hypothetical protein
MAVGALKQKPILKTFRATVHVTRTEPWCIEAEAAEEARELLSAGADRCEIGDCANIEVERVEDRAVARPEPQRSACALPF